MKKFGWGIIGPGAIAHRFLNDLPRCERARLQAVCSRSAERAESFARQYGFAAHYDSVEAMLADPAVDIVYVATPHPHHFKDVMAALDAGKAVLCEKPVTVNAAQLRLILQKAKEKQVFFMEGLKTRFFPVSREIADRIHSGRYGTLTLIDADYGFGQWQDRIPADPTTRLYSLDLAGGSLLDVGVYCLSYASWMKGEMPVQYKALATKAETGADVMTAMLLQYGDGAMAVLRSAIAQATRRTTMLYCEEATIEVFDTWRPSKAIIHLKNGEQETIEDAFYEDGSQGFRYEADAVMDCLETGALEHPLMTWQQSLQVMELMDGIREEIGLHYPPHVENAE